MRKSCSALGCALILSLAASQPAKASIIFDNFNADLGHFTSNISTASGSNSNMSASSASTRITTDSAEGAGSNQLVMVPTTAGSSMRLRHLSGGGTPANNVSFNTSAAEDGWIGFYMKTSDAGFNAQIYMEGASVNGSIPKNLIADGQWHLYEWNLDDNSGGPNGWGTISGIITGVATVSDGAHTIDSIVIRNNAFQNSTILFDFLAKSDSGTVAALVPEPATLSLLTLAAAAAFLRRRTRA